MASLLSLPNELVESIATHFEALEDLKSLRLVCSSIEQAMEETLYSRSRLVINVTQKNVDRIESLLMEISERSRQASLIQNLSIRSILPSYESKYDDETYLRAKNLYQSQEKLDAALDSHKLRLTRDLVRLTCGAIRSLSRLKSLSWHILDSDPYWTYEHVLAAVAGLQSLSELSLWVDKSEGQGSPDLVLPLELLPPLRKMVVTARCQDPWKAVFQPLSDCIKRSKNLEYLSLDTGTDIHYSLEGNDSGLLFFNDLIEGCSLFTTPPLTYISLTGWKVEASPSVYNFLRNVRTASSFTMDSLDHKFITRLHEEGIHLENVDVSSIDAIMLRYLGSYSGIKKLGLGVKNDADPALLRMFIEEVLPAQGPFLENLTISPDYEGPWCFNKVLGLALTKNCPNLKEISLTLNTGNLRNIYKTGDPFRTFYKTKKPSFFDSVLTKLSSISPSKSLLPVFLRCTVEEENCDELKCLIDVFSFHPCLRHIRIGYAMSPAVIGSFCGNVRMQHRRDAIELIAKSVSEMARSVLVEPAAFHRDFCLEVGTLTANQTYQVRPKTVVAGIMDTNKHEWVLTKEIPYSEMYLRLFG